MIGVIDVGTTAIKLAVYDGGNLVEYIKKPLSKHNPRPGWVELLPDEIARISREFADYAIEKHEVEAIGITNQRATCILWDKKTKKAVMPALAWQDTRTSELAMKLNSDFRIRLGRSLGKIVAKFSEIIPTLKSGRRMKWLITLSRLSLKPGHMSVNLRWMLDELGDKAGKYKLKAGTIDSWVVYTLTGELATDYSNASATGIYDLFYMRWSKTILEIIDVDDSILPDIKPSDSIFGEYRNVPISGVISDQSASLFSLGCWEKGDLKMTNGTGSFIDLNVGDEPLASSRGLIPLIAWKIKGEICYMLEGIINFSGSAVELLKNLGLFKDVKETSELAFNSGDDKILIVPSFTGLATPHYAEIPGIIYGISNVMKREDLVKALLESLAFRAGEIIEIMRKEVPLNLTTIKCDGEMSSNDFFLQRIADVTNLRVERGSILYGSSFGANIIAGMGLGKWKKDFYISTDKIFERKEDVSDKFERWKKLVKISKSIKL